MGGELVYKAMEKYNRVRISWVRWREDPAMMDLELQVVLNLRDETP